MKNVEILDISTDSNYGSSHISQSESYKAAKIQYYSSIYNSIVLAYNEAKKENSSINIEYSFVGCDVTFYGSNSDFRIGDRIIKLNGHKIDTWNYLSVVSLLKYECNELQEKLIREGDLMSIDKLNELKAKQEEYQTVAFIWKVPS